MLPEVGHKFGPYEILGKLGGGGMGVVFRAWDDRLHREVAVKLLHDEYQAPGMRQRFLLEARAASALNHPHICTIFDMGEQDGEPFLVMELLEGITLKERITQGACTSEEIVRFGSEIADALSAAHSKGIVHRDVKPANIFLQGKLGLDRQVKVLDFGLAKVSMALRSGRDSRALELTAAGSTVGTLAYMSPEQARGEHLDLRSDLFSLGIVMYEMATRRTPFRGATTALAFQALLTEAPDPIRTWNVAIPRELERIITRLLVKDRSERYQTARDVEEALRRLATRGDGDWLRKLPRPDVPLVPSLDPIARRPRRLRSRNESEQEETATAENGQHFTSDPSVDTDFIRPRRMPRPENRPPPGSSSEGSTFATVDPKTEQHLITLPSRSFPESASVPSGSTDPVDAAQSVAGLPDNAFPTAAEFSPRKIVESGTAGQQDAPFAVEPEIAASGAEVITAPSAGESDPSSKASGLGTGVPTPKYKRSAIPADKASPSGSRRKISGLSQEESEKEALADPSKAVLAPRKRTPKLRNWLISAGVLAMVLLGLGALLMRSGSLGRIVLASQDTILLAPVVNRTGDANLNGVVEEGLEIELTQHSHNHWLGLAALDAGKTQAAAADHVSPETISVRTAAQRLGARAYLYGELSRRDSGYLLRFDIIDEASNDRLGSFTETASSTNDLSTAITRLSVSLRTRVGETDPAGKAQTSTSLALQTTSNMAALSLFAQAQAAGASGDVSRATDLYERAVVEAPDFTLAELQLAQMYAREGAEVAAARMASRARASSGRTGDRVAPLAQIAAALLVDQDPARATVLARQLLTMRPHDEFALIAMAHVMRSQGHMTEALLTAEQAYKLYPFSAAAYSEAAYALIGLDRFQEARSLERKASSLGLHCNCGADIAAYLDGQAEGTYLHNDLQAIFNRAFALDDSGQFSAATSIWRAGVNEAKSHAESASAGSGMLAQAAVDRALANRCSDVPAFVHDAELLPTGRIAAFHIALAEALCLPPAGNSVREADTHLADDARPHSMTSELLLPLVHGAESVSAKQSLQALAALSKVESARDQFPTAAYLRGLAHALGGQNNLAAADFEQAGRRHGYAFLSHSTVSPLAIQRLAALLAASGEDAASNVAHQKFQKLWAKADSPLLTSKPRTKLHGEK